MNLIQRMISQKATQEEVAFEIFTRFEQNDPEAIRDLKERVIKGLNKKGYERVKESVDANFFYAAQLAQGFSGSRSFSNMTVNPALQTGKVIEFYCGAVGREYTGRDASRAGYISSSRG